MEGRRRHDRPRRGLDRAAVGYGLAARRRSPRGRRWPLARAASFLAGLALLALVDASGLEVYEDQPAVHVVAHVSGAALTLAGAAVVAVRTGATTRMTTSPSRRAVLGEGSVGGPA